MSRLSLRLLGSPEITIDGKPVETDRRKAVALLCYLAVSGEQHSRDVLAALFWPDYDRKRAYAYLRRTLWELNQVLEDGWIEADRDEIGIRRGASLQVDVLRFQDLLAKGKPTPESLVEAIDLYQGDFLAGFGLRDSPVFDEWHFYTSERLKLAFAGALESLVELSIQQGAPQKALPYAQRWLSLDNLNEAAHRALMRLYALAGQRSAALRQYEECANLLERELQIEPEAATQALCERIRSGELSAPPQGTAVSPGEGRAAEPPAPALQPIWLPKPGTAFVGRGDDLARIRELLADPQSRLVTLLGAGGIGKTRLGIEAAHSSAGLFPDGVYFIPLAALSDPAGLALAIAEAVRLDLRSEPTSDQRIQSALEKLVDFLREKRVLLVLDNFEHLAESAEIVTELIGSADGLKVLVTSRQRLNLREEHIVSVMGMSYPVDDQVASNGKYSALALFEQSARQSLSDFSVEEVGLAQVSRICRLLEGVPLGIELAAAWVRFLPLQEIAEEIERNMDFLSSNVRGIPERHQSLRAVFQHSWELLEGSERDAFIRMAVFKGGFSRQAASQVSGATLPVLASLVDQSLLHRLDDQRYNMHEMLRQYAGEKLAEDAVREEECLDRHSAYYLDWLTQHTANLQCGEQGRAASEIDREFDNVRAAWKYAVASQNWQRLYPALKTLILYILVYGKHELLEPLFQLLSDRVEALPSSSVPVELRALTCGANRFAKVMLERSGKLPNGTIDRLQAQGLKLAGEIDDPLERAAAYLILEFGNWILGPDEVEVIFPPSLETFKQAGLRWEQAMSYFVYADYVIWIERNLSLGMSLLEESLRIFSVLGDQRNRSLVLASIAHICIDTGDYARAQDLIRQAVEISRENQQLRNEADLLFRLGQTATALGEYDQAVEYYEQGLRALERLGDRWELCSLLDALGYTELLRERLDAAERHYRRSLEIARILNWQHGTAMAQMNLGDVARNRREFGQARRLYQDALSDLQPEDSYWGTEVVLKKLGQLSLLENELEEAGRYLQKALKIAVQIERPPEILEILSRLAFLAAKDGDLERAVCWLALVENHPGSAQDVRSEAAVALAGLREQLPEEEFRQAERCGAAGDLEQMASEYLSSLEDV